MSISFKSITLNSAGTGTLLKDVLDATKSAQDLFASYSGTTDLNDLILYNETENVTKFFRMYYNCQNATTFPLINTSNGTNFSYMYYYCNKATSFPELNTSNGTDFSYMYYGCNKTTSFPALDTSKGTNFKYMYQNSSKATSFPLLNTSNGTDFSYMYSGCKNATTYPAIDTSQGTNFEYMYSNCETATSFPPLDTSNGTRFKGMYNVCRKATSFPPLNTSKGTDFTYMFYYCNEIEKIDISHFKFSSTTYTSYWCAYDYKLKAVIIRSFGSSYALNSSAFNSCYHILGTKNTIYNPEGLKDGYIYVPRDMIETLSTATNWSTYASQLRALEDYTVDGTTTGAFDDAKAGL